MLPLTRNRKIRVSNRLAIIAAIMLLTSTLAGLGSSINSEGGQDSLMASQSFGKSEPVVAQAKNSNTAKKQKGFKVSLFLFRRN